MDLLAALEIRRGERLALVGGGGKTGLATRLMAEARGQGWRVLFTTTTRILPPADAARSLLVLGEEVCHVEPLRRRLQQEGALVLARRWLPEWEETTAGRRQKLGGLGAEEVDRLTSALEPDLLIVEADGSRHRPFKAPAPYEPVIPAATTLVAVLAGLSVLGRPLEAPYVHRPERVAELGGVPLGTPVDAALLAAVLAHPAGGRQGLPAEARAVAVLTQAGAARLAAGRQVARRLLLTPGWAGVLLLDLAAPSVVVERWEGTAGETREGRPRVAAVVLAAGAGRRYGGQKLLRPLAGRPLVAHAVDAALGSAADAVWVVVGAEAAAVRAALGTRPLGFLENPHWPEGLSASIRAAVGALADRAEGLLFLAGDMPLISPAHLDRLIARFRAGAKVVWSAWGSSWRIPTLFGRETFPALGGLKGETGGRNLRGLFPEEAVAVAAEHELADVDSARDYEQVRRWLERPAAESPETG